MKAYHYTVANRMDSIREHGIELAQALVPITEKAAVWFSTNPVYDTTACKYGTKSLKEMVECGAKPIRYVVDMALTSWVEHKKTSGILPVMARGLENAGKAVGSNPKEWYCVYEPVKEWLAVEAYKSGKWVEVRRNKAPSEKALKTRKKIQAKPKTASKGTPSSSTKGRKEPTKKLVVNKLWNEDCIEMLHRLPDECVDVVVTSPPYDGMKAYTGYVFDFEATARELARVLRPGGRICWVVADQIVDGSLTGTSHKHAMFFREKLGLKFSEDITHERSGFAFPSRTRHHQVTEHVYVFSKGKPKTFNPIIDRANKYVGIHGGERSYRGEFGRRTNVWKYPNGGNHTDRLSTGHPAPMVEAMAHDLILTYSEPGDVVCDPFSGSGTTPVEAMLLGRKWIGSEISAEYCAMIERRFKAAKERMRTGKASAKKGGNPNILDPCCGSSGFLKMATEMAKKAA